ncbi:YqgE/AlgH family protein [Marisediminitalea sp.]|uniref:YqgE/AlgH family protein n=1 Tax=Marisediminitalea sp. TaxID=2662268 RepID=UPI0033772093|nr:YqgE/AlgH family protein [Aestuariibacter sp.]MCP4232754.1 YqgE/AlgH family protein [Aestuariibacter sp.]MCP4524535.1 YqgE/AlgH family protein [Aestuariibacter sp.]MCP4948839.1 YqgE/AlgH family protein [Aestuariibacter sp.]MCP5010491.1 YqgE/AlgH family protein [Aestuariibacter sp.]
MTELKSLANHFLIAMPSMEDPFFARSLTYICEHNDEGAMGLVVNHPTNMTLRELLEQAEKGAEIDDEKGQQIVLSGGPVSQERGFILHSPQPGWSSSLSLTPEIMVTTSKDILSALGNHRGPDQAIITLGYAGWSEGQLEEEIQDNAWLTIEADPAILFNTPIHKRWEAAVQQLGVDVWQLAPQVGHA